MRVATTAAAMFASFGAAHAHASSEAEQKARWDQAQKDQRNFTHRMFTDAGFSSIAELGAEGRNVRRVLLRDPYGMLPTPGIELERLNDRVTLRLQYRGWSSQAVPFVPSVWEKLAEQEAVVFAEPVYRPAPTPVAPGGPPPPPRICHGWSVSLEADYKRTAGWSQCGGAIDPAFHYAVQMVAQAMKTRPDCPFDSAEPFWSFNKCFAPSLALDDPKLEATFSALRKTYDEVPGADRLMEARQALRAPGLTLGNEAWQQARAATAKVKEVNDLRRDCLQQLQRLAHGPAAANASDADKAKMQQTIEVWRDFTQSQETNYADLLQGLVWSNP